MDNLTANITWIASLKNRKIIFDERKRNLKEVP